MNVFLSGSQFPRWGVTWNLLLMPLGSWCETHNMLCAWATETGRTTCFIYIWRGLNYIFFSHLSPAVDINKIPTSREEIMFMSSPSSWSSMVSSSNGQLRGPAWSTHPRLPSLDFGAHRWMVNQSQPAHPSHVQS